MKATKVILPNGKERILIEVKPSEYYAMQDSLTCDYANTDGEAPRERKRMEVFDRAMADSTESFDVFVDRKEYEAEK